MNSEIFKSVVTQFKKLISKRNHNPINFYFSANSIDKIHVFDKNSLRFIIDVKGFLPTHVLDPGFTEWAKYKTRTLNKALNTVAFNTDTMCVNWQIGLEKGNTGGVGNSSDKIDSYLANSSSWDGVTMDAVLSNQGNDSSGNPLKLMIFDSNNPSGGDSDLKTPILDPSKVVGGIDPLKNHGNLLIVSENNDISSPNDKHGLSEVTFTFSESVVLESLEFIDSDEPALVVVNTHTITMYDGPNGTGTNLGRLFISKLGDNSAEKLTIYKPNVRSFIFKFVGSGAISDICFKKQSTSGFAFVSGSDNSCFTNGSNSSSKGWMARFNKSTNIDNTFNIYANPTSCNDFNNLIGTAHMYYKKSDDPDGFIFMDIVLTDSNYELVKSNIYLDSIPGTNYNYKSEIGSIGYNVIGESNEKEHFYDINYSSITEQFYLVIKVKVQKIQ